MSSTGQKDDDAGNGRQDEKKVAVVGCGLVGRAWAIAFARAGYQVAMYDGTQSQVTDALAFANQTLAELQKRDLLRGQTSSEVRAKLQQHATLEGALAGAVYVQESTYEDVEIKKQVFADLDRLADTQTLLASSTSALLPSAFTESLPGRDRCLVVHPINPPYLVPAVEVVPSPWTSEHNWQRAGDFIRSIGQSPIMMKKEIDGFVMNRLQGAVLQEAMRLVEDGIATTEDIDIGIRDGLGLRWSFMGPFETIDLNAPGGVVDYMQRFGGLYAGLAKSQTRPVAWDSQALQNTVESERRARLPRTNLSERSLWRDEKLMSLLCHRRDESTKEN